MTSLFKSFFLQRTVIESPSDIIMAAQIIQKYIILGQCINNIELPLQQSHVSRCNRMPSRCHRCDIVQHMTLRFFHRTEIWRHFLRFHNYFSQQKDSRADNLTYDTHHANDRMYLLKISAGSI